MELVVRDLAFSYASTPVLEDVSLEAVGGEILGIVGPNGSGKSTLLKCINQVLGPRAGVVLLDGSDLSTLTRREIARHVGVVPQDAGVGFPFTVMDLVLMGRTPHLGPLDIEGPGDLEAAERAMRATGVEQLADRLVTEISGGERQRVIIARTLCQETEVLLLDEPTLHLDINHQLEVLELIRALADERDLVVLMATHDLSLASRYCDRILLLDAGRIGAAGTSREVLTPENLRRVYGIEAHISRHEPSGSLVIIPLVTVERDVEDEGNADREE